MKSMLFVVVLTALIASSFALKCYYDCEGTHDKVDTSNCKEKECDYDNMLCGRSTPAKKGAHVVKTKLMGCITGIYRPNAHPSWRIPAAATCSKGDKGEEICLCKGNLCNEAGATIATTFTVAGTLVSVLALYTFS